MTDDLTLAYNQRYLSPRVNEEIEQRARRTGQPLLGGRSSTSTTSSS